MYLFDWVTICSIINSLQNKLKKTKGVIAEEASADVELGEQSWFRLYVGISEDQMDFLLS